MTAKCQRCTAPSHNAFLCKTCAGNLKAALAELPWWQRRLTEAALGQAKMGDNGGRRSARARDIHGDEFADRALGVITATGAHADQVDRAIRQQALARALAAGGVNAAASQLLGRIADELGSWCRVLCEERQMQYTPTRIVDRASACGEEHSTFLYANVRAITASECAGDIADDILGRDRKRGGYVDEISRAINPTDRHLVGPCPTITGRNPDGTARQCARVLFADTYDRTTACPDCHQDIDVESTRQRAAAARDHHSRDNLLEILYTIGEPVDACQLDRWIAAERLRPAGWHHDDTIVEFRISAADRPVYSLTRARKLRRRDNELSRRRKVNT